MNTGSLSSSSGVYLGGDSSGGGDGGGGYLDGGGYGSGSGGGVGGGGGSYMVSSVSKVRSSSSGGTRRSQANGSSGGLSPGFRERKTLTSRSGGYDGEILLIKSSWHQTGQKQKLEERRKPPCMRVLLTFLLLLCFLVGSSSGNSSPEFTRKDYGIYCEWDWRLCWNRHLIFPALSSYLCFLPLFPVFFVRLRRHKREEWKQRYALILICSSAPFIISASSASESSWLSLLNQDSFVYCVILFQRARSEPDYRAPLPRPADVRPLETHWSLSVMQSPHKETKHLYESLFIQRSTQIFGLELCCCRMFRAHYTSHTKTLPSLPPLAWMFTSMKFQLVTHVQLLHTVDSRHISAKKGRGRVKPWGSGACLQCVEVGKKSRGRFAVATMAHMSHCLQNIPFWTKQWRLRVLQTLNAPSADPSV